MKITKETWKDILKIVGTIIATIASVLGVQAEKTPSIKEMGEAWKTASPILHHTKLTE